MVIDGYKIWTFIQPSKGQGYNFQGTMTRGVTIMKSQSERGVTGVKTWYSLNGPTVLAIANRTGGFLTSTNTTPVQTDWPMFGFSTEHFRFNPYENMLNAAHVSHLVSDWTATTGVSIYSSPSIVNGVVYIGSGDSNLYAFHLPNTVP